MKKILIVNGNPKAGSFCQALAAQYGAALLPSELVQVQTVHLHQLDFSVDLPQAYHRLPELEPDLVHFQQQLLWADHLVLCSPVWWGGMPARFKGLWDRVLLPGFAFQYHSGSAMPEQLLRGRTAQLLITLDTPIWLYRYWQRAPLYHQLKRTVLDFVGIKTCACHYFGPVTQADDQRRQQWLAKAARLGRQACA